MRAIPLARSARRRLNLDPPIVAPNGLFDARDAGAARRIAGRINRARTDAAPAGATGADDASVSGGDVAALAALGAVLHHVVELERRTADLDLAATVRAAEAKVGKRTTGRVARAWAREFGPDAPSSEDLAAELLVLTALNENPAAAAVRALVDDRPLHAVEGYLALVASIEQSLGGRGGRGERGGRSRVPPTAARPSLPARLREPMRRAPGSLRAQLLWVRRHWRDLLADDPALEERVVVALDVLAEEARAAELRALTGVDAPFGGPIGPETPDFKELRGEPEAFSPDTEWMAGVVLLAKSTYVWLDQLGRTYGRPVETLADVPDEELDRLAGLGVTGLWLIGIWRRSLASAEIKRRRGDLDAVASAYAIDDYGVADELGGETAFADLRERAMRRGIRLAADMVPNHMGIDSRWVIEHPDRFLSLPESPFPAYTFDGPDLSSDGSVEIKLEDHYWDASGASVVFRRRDRHSGEERFVYHGNDASFVPWNDTAQLDYLRPDVRAAVMEVILECARRAPILRFDAAMVLAKRHIRRLWYPEPGSAGAIPSRAEHALSDAAFDRLMPREFWREVVDLVAAEAPGTLLLAEAFWLLEGYFVRTLGMHRVYNSAFMHMVRDEDNAGYRRLIKETLAADPRILERFVSFMTNPDERPAVEQFGSGDKAFAAATLLATLPGMPMLGHGQVEGFRERYGMEFRRARWDEPRDDAHEAHFVRTIVPLLEARSRFARTEGFHFYDATADDGRVVEDVYAYSNRDMAAGVSGGPPTLVLVHNWPASVTVTIDHAAPARTGAARPGGGRRLVRTRLVDELGLARGSRDRVRFVDRRSGWEVIRSADEVRDAGLRVELGPYEARVLEIEPLPHEPSPPAPSIAPPEAVEPVATEPGSRPPGRTVCRRAAPKSTAGQAPKSARRSRGKGSSPRPMTDSR